VKEKCEKSHIEYEEIGLVGGELLNINDELNIGINELAKLYENTIETIMSK